MARRIDVDVLFEQPDPISSTAQQTLPALPSTRLCIYLKCLALKVYQEVLMSRAQTFQLVPVVPE
jgi:hypothetical protein